MAFLQIKETFWELGRIVLSMCALYYLSGPGFPFEELQILILYHKYVKRTFIFSIESLSCYFLINLDTLVLKIIISLLRLCSIFRINYSHPSIHPSIQSNALQVLTPSVTGRSDNIGDIQLPVSIHLHSAPQCIFNF